VDKTTKEIMYRFKSHSSKTDTPTDMVGVPVLKLLRQWPTGVLACALGTVNFLGQNEDQVTDAHAHSTDLS